METLSERAERLAREHMQRNAPAMRRAFWEAKAEAALVEAKPGVLERAAMGALGNWIARYEAARAGAPLRLIQGGRV